MLSESIHCLPPSISTPEARFLSPPGQALVSCRYVHGSPSRFSALTVCQTRESGWELMEQNCPGQKIESVVVPKEFCECDSHIRRHCVSVSFAGSHRICSRKFVSLSAAHSTKQATCKPALPLMKS